MEGRRATVRQALLFGGVMNVRARYITASGGDTL